MPASVPAALPPSPPPSALQYLTAPPLCRLCVPACAFVLAADEFREYFSQFGEVVEAQIMQDHMSGRSRGFGCVPASWLPCALLAVGGAEDMLAWDVAVTRTAAAGGGESAARWN